MCMVRTGKNIMDSTEIDLLFKPGVVAYAPGILLIVKLKKYSYVFFDKRTNKIYLHHSPYNQIWRYEEYVEELTEEEKAEYISKANAWVKSQNMKICEKCHNCLVDDRYGCCNCDEIVMGG